ncbi:MAG: hypothetical protein CEE41_02445 [Hadesarchaea archaeon B3_Hades]|nr:MAG: hypothetical protein CEE41_02445 [Hadesarchaea archaeon B3_Hades]
MRLKEEQRGFVLSGIALLLVLPAMLLAASCFRIIETGGEAVSLQATADKVFYTGDDIERIINDMWDENLLANNESNVNVKFDELADNYRVITGLLVDLTPSWKLWIHVENNGADHYAGTKYCKVEHVAPENWRYYFEDLDEEEGETPDWDYDEPILLVEKIGSKLRITIEDYTSPYYSDIYYSGQLLWSDVGGTGKNHVGENIEVDGVLQLEVSVYVRDPRGATRYSSTVELE